MISHLTIARRADEGSAVKDLLIRKCRMDWPIRNQRFVGQSANHGWVIRPGAGTDYQVDGYLIENGRCFGDLANPSYGVCGTTASLTIQNKS